MKERDNDYFTSVVFMYYENLNKWFTNLIDCKPEKIGEYMFAFIDDVFKMNGMPDEVVVSDRYIFTGVNKTLKKLNISTMFLREENDFARGCYGNLAKVLEKLDFLHKTFENAPSEEEFIKKLEESPEEFMDFESEEDYDYEEEFFGEDSESSFVA